MCIYICLSREKTHINVCLQISLIMYVLLISSCNPKPYAKTIEPFFWQKLSKS